VISCSLLEHLKDDLQHVISACSYFLVPESDHSPTSPLEPSRAPLLCFVIVMLSAVGLDRAPVLNAREVDNERSDGMLAAKLEADESATPETRPEPPFGSGHRNA
jgi:hypothetical protein